MNPEMLAGLQTFLTKTMVELGFNLMIALAIAVVGYWLAGQAGKAANRVVDRSPRVDSTLKPLLITIVRQAVLVITGLMVLGRFGVETASIIAILGAAGLAIGLALQGTLSNVAAGVMLLVLRPFSVGEAIEVGGRSGTVRQIGLFTVELDSFDNVFVSLPNSRVWNEPIINFSRNPYRRIDLVIGIDYSDDIDKAMAIALEILTADEHVRAEPAPMVAVKNLGESSIDLAVRGHADIGVYWPTVFRLQKTIKEAYDANDITIPFPQRTLHVPGDVRMLRDVG